jgi:hypothetical protein
MKKPDQIVYDETNEKYDAYLKQYPTSVGSQHFEIVVVDKTDTIKAQKYFNSRLDEIKQEYKRLLEEYDNTKLVYESQYSFQPIVGETYYVYSDDNGKNFLSIIKPNEWKKECLGGFKLLNNGVWENVL